MEEFEKLKNSEFWNLALERNIKDYFNSNDGLNFGFILGYLSCMLYQGDMCLECFDNILDFLSEKKYSQLG